VIPNTWIAKIIIFPYKMHPALVTLLFLILVGIVVIVILAVMGKFNNDDSDDEELAEVKQELAKLAQQRARDEAENRHRDALLSREVADKSLGMNFIYPGRVPAYNFPYFYGSGGRRHRRRHH